MAIAGRRPSFVPRPVDRGRLSREFNAGGRSTPWTFRVSRPTRVRQRVFFIFIFFIFVLSALRHGLSRLNVDSSCPRSCAYREVNSERRNANAKSWSSRIKGPIRDADRGDRRRRRRGWRLREDGRKERSLEVESREESSGGWERADLILERASSSFYTRWFYIRPLSCYRASPYGCVGRAFTVSSERPNTRGRANTSEILDAARRSTIPLWRTRLNRALL